MGVHTEAMSTKKITATVAIPTFNGEEFLDDVLTALDNQETDFEHEVLVIDSGSSDNTLEIIANHPKVRLHEIPNKEFGHGKTRNLAVKMANGEFVAFLTQDAVPAHPGWLAEMIRPFSISEDVVAVLGKQVPRPDCCATVKREVAGVFHNLGPDQSIMIQRKSELIQDQAAIDATTFYSDSNSALRKSINKTIPYADVNYAEDQVFGKAVIEAGLLKAYAPLGSVLHSHNYATFKYFRRKYDEFVALRKITGQAVHAGPKEMTIGNIRAMLGDFRFIIKDRDYSLPTKLKWILLTPLYTSGLRLAIFLASRKTLPGWAKMFLSLEANAKKKAKK